MSVNVDELSETEIVAPKILEMLGRQTGVDMEPPAVHAGVQHTYGYLLSLIKTPFGYKRQRWIEPTIERGFALPVGSLQALPRRGTLLGNLTDFLSQISLRDQRRLRLTKPSPISKSWHPAGVTGWRINETFRLGKNNSVSISTDLVPFSRGVKSKASALLIYAIATANQPAKLITTFPIHPDMQSSMLDLPCGRGVEIRLRFNAFVHGCDREPMRGQRSVQKWSID